MWRLLSLSTFTWLHELTQVDRFLVYMVFPSPTELSHPPIINVLSTVYVLLGNVKLQMILREI